MTDEFVQFAQKALIIKDRKLLIIRKSTKDSNNPNKWEIPGGRKQKNETLDEQIIREVKEETSLIIKPKDIFDMWQFSIPLNDKDITVIAVARFCDVVDDNLKITEDVIDNFKWVNIDKDLLNYNFIPGIKNTIEKLVNIYTK